MEMKKTPLTIQSATIKKNFFEIAAWELNSTVAGIDEVGRGCLAGPLVTAAVILPPYTTYPHLKDSKIMTPQEREKAFRWIQKKCYYGIGIVHNRIIDKHNIWQSTLISMKKALINLIEVAESHPSAILIDAMPLDTSDTHLQNIPVHRFYYGEKKSSSIAAASIVAKVTRDALMESLDNIIPGYKFAENKGYATTVHRTAIKKESHSIIHRMSFLKNIHTNNLGLQLSLDSLGQTLQEENILIEEIDSHEAGDIFCGSN